MRTFGPLFVGLALVAAPCSALAAALSLTPLKPQEIVQVVSLRYLSPDDWTCNTTKDKFGEGCLTCFVHGPASASSNIVVTRAPSDSQTTFTIPAFSQVRSCGNVVFIPSTATQPEL